RSDGIGTTQLKSDATYSEKDPERALIADLTNLQAFLSELDDVFSFVVRKSESCSKTMRLSRTRYFSQLLSGRLFCRVWVSCEYGALGVLCFREPYGASRMFRRVFYL